MNDNFRQGMYALIVVALAFWFVGWAGGHDARRGEDLPPDVAAAVEELRDGKVGVEPAEPTEPTKELKPGMAWQVSGAGDAGYNGVYVEDGSYGGKSVVGEVADNLALGCGGVVVGALVVIDLFCWAAGWDFVAGALATALILGLTRGRK